MMTTTFYNQLTETKYIKPIINYGQIHQFSSVTQLCPTLWNPMNHSTPGLPVHHQLPEFTQTHVHQVSDAIQPSHPLLSPSPPAPNPSQHQSHACPSDHHVSPHLEVINHDPCSHDVYFLPFLCISISLYLQTMLLVYTFT